MTDRRVDAVSAHYTRSGLLQEVLDAFAGAGIGPGDLDVDVLASVDEFHLGGRAATSALVDDVAVDADARVLDVGCGIGGAARLIAQRAGCHVTGVDLTSAFVEAAAELSTLVGMDAQTTFHVADALDLPFDDGSFDVVTMFHVGMNVADKAALLAELARMLRPGGALAVYDIMRVGEGTLRYPVPWATDASTSFLAGPEDYRRAVVDAGLVAADFTNRLELVTAAAARSNASPPPVNLGHLMGSRWPEMFANLRTALQEGVVAPVQVIATAPVG